MARIVIADDNKELVSMISEFLKMQTNFDVVKTFTGGKNLLTYLETNTCDILLLDIFMPEMDGVNILTELNNNKKYMRPGKIIVLTAFNTESLMSKTSLNETFISTTNVSPKTFCIPLSVYTT